MGPVLLDCPYCGGRAFTPITKVILGSPWWSKGCRSCGQPVRVRYTRSVVVAMFVVGVAVGFFAHDLPAVSLVLLFVGLSAGWWYGLYRAPIVSHQQASNARA